MKLVPVNLEAKNLVKQLRDGLVYEVHTKDVCFTGEVFRDAFETVWFRPLRIPNKPSDDHRVPLGDVTRLMWHNALLPAR